MKAEDIEMLAHQAEVNARKVERLEQEIAALRNALNAAYSALRSYQHGNSAPDLAERIADHISPLLGARWQPGGGER